MSSALRLSRAARPLTSATQTARFSLVHRIMAAGDAGAPRSGGAASSDAFTKREEASENLYIRQHEKEKLDALRKKIQQGESQLAKDKAELDQIQKK